jgi:hypothetical protein
MRPTETIKKSPCIGLRNDFARARGRQCAHTSYEAFNSTILGPPSCGSLDSSAIRIAT